MALLSEDQRSRVEHVACDFLSKPEEIAKQLTDSNVTADYVFFCGPYDPKYVHLRADVRCRQLRTAQA